MGSSGHAKESVLGPRSSLESPTRVRLVLFDFFAEEKVVYVKQANGEALAVLHRPELKAEGDEKVEQHLDTTLRRPNDEDRQQEQSCDRRRADVGQYDEVVERRRDRIVAFRAPLMKRVPIDKEWPAVTAWALASQSTPQGSPDLGPSESSHFKKHTEEGVPLIRC